MATIRCPGHRQIGTLRPYVFKKSEPCPGETEVIQADIHMDPKDIRTQMLELIQEMWDANVDLE